MVYSLIKGFGSLWGRHNIHQCHRKSQHPKKALAKVGVSVEGPPDQLA